MAPLCTTVKLSDGKEMPLVGLGMWQTNGVKMVEDVVTTAIKVGYRHFDTAVPYKNEADLGRALLKCIDDGLVQREDLFVVSKLPSNGMRSESVEYFLKRSLNLLQMEYLDLYLVHFPVPSKRTEDDEEIMPLRKDGDLDTDDIDLTETWSAMESMVKKGLVKSIGLSNVNSKQLNKIYLSSKIKPAVLQVECHAYLPQYELVELCENLKIAFTAYAPLGTPGLPAFALKYFGIDFKPDILLKDEKLQPIAKKHDKSNAQILLRYLIQRNIAVIPKSSNLNRIKENLQIFDFSLDNSDMEDLKSMAKNYRYFKFDSHPRMVSHPEYPFNVPF